MTRIKTFDDLEFRSSTFLLKQQRQIQEDLDFQNILTKEVLELGVSKFFSRLVCSDKQTDTSFLFDGDRNPNSSNSETIFIWNSQFGSYELLGFISLS